LNDIDGSETLTLRFSGFPEAAVFSKGALDPVSGDWVIADAAESLHSPPSLSP
jgi:hypothetical protein